MLLPLTFPSLTHAQFTPGAPVYEITPGTSKIAFYVKASVRLDGNFDKWNAALAFTSTDPSTGLLNIKIRLSSLCELPVFTLSALEGKRLLRCGGVPVYYVSIHEDRPDRFTQFRRPRDVHHGGISKAETLSFTADREGEGTGEIQGTQWFDRKDFGLGGHVHFVTIADRAELIVDFKATRISGPPLLFKQ